MINWQYTLTLRQTAIWILALVFGMALSLPAASVDSSEDDVGITLTEVVVTPTGHSGRLITGSVTNRITGSALFFEAIEQDGSSDEGPGLRSGTLRDQDGTLLVEYTESSQAPVYKNAKLVGYESLPTLQFKGSLYAYDSELAWRTMEEIASSPAGELIKYLALNVVFHLPNDELVDLRRVLEVPFQAMQSLYDAPDIAGTARSIERLIESRSSQTNTSIEQIERSTDFTLFPSDCIETECEYLVTSDYIFSHDGGSGFVNLTLSQRLVLSHNYEAEASLSMIDADKTLQMSVSAGGEFSPLTSKSAEKLSSFDVGSGTDNNFDFEHLIPRASWMDWEAGDCRGRCGPGCGTWSCSKYDLGPLRYAFTKCNSSTRWQERDYYRQSYSTVCTATGSYSAFCRCHDDCMRGSTGGPFNGWCEVKCLGKSKRKTRKTWTAGPRRQTHTVYIATGNTCWY